MHRRFISLEATRKLHRCFWKPWTVNEEAETEWPRYSNSILYYSDTSFQTITCEQGTSPESSVHLKCTAPEFWHACRPNHGHQFDEGLRGFSWASNQHWSASWMLSGRRSTKGWAQQHQRHLQEHQCTAWLLRSGHITGLSDTRRICSASQTDFEQSGQKLRKLEQLNTRTFHHHAGEAPHVECVWPTLEKKYPHILIRPVDTIHPK